MIRTSLVALLFTTCVLLLTAAARPLDDLPVSDPVVTDSALVVTLDDSAPSDAAPAGTSPMLASVGLLGVAGVAGGSLLAFRPGDRVTYVDEAGVPHAALVTRWWDRHDRAACNLAYIDPEQSDSYGAERVLVSSVSRGDGSYPGRYWEPAEELVSAEPEAPAIPAPPPVTGYRQLAPEECALINEAKAAVNAYGAVLDKLAAHPDTDKRWLAIARTDAQTSSMAACRAITRPTSFA